MTFNSYLKKILKNFDDILLNHSFNGCNFISIFYFVRGHYNFTNKFIYHYKQKSFFVLFKNIFFFLLRRFRSLFYNLNHYEKNIRNNNYDYIIVSHKIDLKTYDLKNDFYYGKLIDYLINQKKKVCVILFNQTLISTKKLFNSKIKKSKADVLLLNNKVNLFLDLKVIFKIFHILTSFLLVTLYKNYSYKIPIVSSLFDEETFSNIRIYNQFKLINKLKFNNVILTYEGHSYERAIIRSFRNFSPKTKIFAYCHSVLYPSLYSIYNSYGYKNDPDVILLGSKNLLNKFLKKSKYNRKYLAFDVLGSKKASKVNFSKNNSQNNFLIIPDGTDYDIDKHYLFAIKLANFYTNYSFTINLHPNSYKMFNIIKFKQIKKNLNVKIGSLDDCLKNNHFVIFSSSSAVIQCINHGLLPIYYDYKKLYEFNDNPFKTLWKKNLTIRTVNDLNRLLLDYKLPSDLKKYALNYYSNFNFSILNKY